MQRFAETAERIAATTKKLEKERILSEYLTSLDDEDLVTAVHFFSGTPFALRDQRTVNTGFAAVRDALLEMHPAWEDQLGPALLRTGDAGDAVAELMSLEPPRAPALTLRDVASYYHELTTSIAASARRSRTREILEKATPLEAKYILKILLGGLRIGLQESLVESSLAKAYGVPPADLQRANMMLGDLGECALLSRRGRLKEATMRLLHPLKPMLASPEEDVVKILDAMDGRGFAEDKYDGIRAQVHKQEGEIRIYSRDLDDITRSFPDVVGKMAEVPGAFLLDGEIVPYRDGRILTFGELQTRLGRKDLPEQVLNAVPCRYFAFDALFINGEALFERPLQERKQLLRGLHALAPESFSLSEMQVVETAEQIENAFGGSRARNNEGLVVKHPDSPYVPGKRGKGWLKLKRALITLDVVVVGAEYGHGKRRGLLSDYTFAVKDGDRLLTIGKAYSGMTDQELARLSEHFHNTSIARHGHYHDVAPEIVFEVAFDRINRSNRHTSGFALRFPRIKQIRWDKKPEEIDTLQTVESLFSQHFS